DAAENTPFANQCADWARKAHIPLSTVSLAIPRADLVVRFHHLPTRDPREVSSMVAFHLGVDLPGDLGSYAWREDVIRDYPDGSSVVCVHILRRDRLNALLESWRQAGAAAVWPFPEGLVLSRLLRTIRAKPADPTPLHPDAELAAQPSGSTDHAA